MLILILLCVNCIGFGAMAAYALINALDHDNKRAQRYATSAAVSALIAMACFVQIAGMWR